MILDHIDNLTFDPGDQDYLYEAQMTLGRLSRGLFWLNDAVTAAELQSRIAAQRENVLVGVVEGVLKDLPIEWLSCAFQWYAVSLYNYVRLAGWLATRDKKKAIDYVHRVIPKVATYRHKIAAHFAITYPKGDNDADLVSSLMTGIVFAHGYLRAGAVSEIVKDASGNDVESVNKTSWSMTKTHGKMTARFWPNGPLPAHSSIRIGPGVTRKLKIDWED